MGTSCFSWAALVPLLTFKRSLELNQLPLSLATVHMCIRNRVFLQRDNENLAYNDRTDESASVSVNTRNSTLTGLPARAGRVEHDTIGDAVDMAEQGS